MVLTHVVGTNPSRIGSFCTEAVVRVNRGSSSVAVDSETAIIMSKKDDSQ